MGQQHPNSGPSQGFPGWVHIVLLGRLACVHVATNRLPSVQTADLKLTMLECLRVS